MPAPASLRHRGWTRAPLALGVPLCLAACSLWVDDTLSRKPAESGTEGAGPSGGGGPGGGGPGGGGAAGGGAAGGADCGLACAAEACCEGACVDLQSSEAHCGACGAACGPTQACCGGMCAGDSAEPCCVDLDCPGGKICSGNTCIPPCEGGLVACAGQCVDLSVSEPHCGACGNDCLAGRTCTLGECSPSWVPMSKTGAPSSREHAAVAWIGGAVFVWGGSDGTKDLAGGGLYDPHTDTWKAITAGAGSPTPRILSAAVWTGAAVFVWGGGPSSGTSALGDGALYDPEAGTWSGVDEELAPAPRRAPIAVWTGSRVLVWGGTANGSPVSGGALYDPASDAWSPVSGSGAPLAREGAAGAWSGAELYLFGGRPGGAGETNEGFAYDPAADTWRSLPLEGAPSPRFDAFVVWAGGRLIVWGGESSSGVLEDGAQYDSAADSWSPITTDGKLSKRSRRVGWSGWTGATAKEALLFGGMDGGNVKTDGKRYDPIADTWTGAGPALKDHLGGAGVWTGGELFLWSGRDGNTLDSAGERYMP